MMPPAYFVWIAVTIAACMCLCERPPLCRRSMHVVSSRAAAQRMLGN